MSKKQLNQNSKYTQELINTFEPDFSFNEEPVNRINMVIKNDSQNSLNKAEKLIDLKSKINSIEKAIDTLFDYLFETKLNKLRACCLP